MKTGIAILAVLFLVPGYASAEDDYHVSLSIPVDPGPEGDLAAQGGNPAISDIIYVNRCRGGCLIRASGFENAITNESSIIQGDVTLSEFKYSDEEFNQIIECLREVYEPYKVRIVTDDPGNVTHHEALLAGTSAEAGFDANVGGVAPFTCTARNNMISYSFSNNSPSPSANIIDLCWTVAQESAHAFGLDHEFDCSDPMTYIPNCGQKFYRNEAFPCGEFNARDCSCGGVSQNSHAKMTAVFGASGVIGEPTVEVLLPADGAQVSEDDTIYVQAIDKRLVSRVEVFVNGFLFNTLDGYDFFESRDKEDVYRLQVGALNHPDGVMDLEFVAYNDLGARASATVSVTKGTPCTSAASCLDGQLCEEGRCFYPEPTAELGDSCVRNMDCVTLQCARSGDDQRCTSACFVGIADQCPDGFDCLAATDGSGLCWPKASDGGCSAGTDGPSAGSLALFGLVFGLLFVRRRRR